MSFAPRVRHASRFVAALTLWGLSCSASLAQPATATEATTAPTRSAMDGRLFFEVLVGEMQWRSGEPLGAIDTLLSAARRHKNEQLFLRATEMAVQARSGDQALVVVQSWRSTLPQSIPAHYYLVQLLTSLGRTSETVEPLRSLVTLTPSDKRPEMMAALPRFFASMPDRSAAAKLVEDVLEPYSQNATKASAPRNPEYTASRLTIARAWLAAKDNRRAYALLQDAHQQDPSSEAPVFLAVEMLVQQPRTEAIITQYLAKQPQRADVRLAYSRSLTATQRFADAIEQLDIVTRAKPELAGPWLALGALHVELRHPQEAQKALQTYLQLVEKSPTDTGKDSDEENEPSVSKGRTEAWIQLAHAAEQLKDYAAAEGWLTKVDDPERATQVQMRRASLLVQQGRLDDALMLVSNLPDTDEATGRTKVFAQAQVLREGKRWKEAQVLLQAASERFPNDASVLYEQSMVAEKLGRYDQMETLLRQVMTLKPDHQYAHNALGYSLADRNLRLKEAKTLIQRALELAPGDPLITDSLGWVEFRLGNKEEAARLLRWAFRARPDAEIGAHLGEVLWVQGQREEARRVWRQAKSRDASNEVLRETLSRFKVDL
ncbi:MAG: tetratricopeptide repeat protein [Burkholderiales bacterium]